MIYKVINKRKMIESQRMHPDERINISTGKSVIFYDLGVCDWPKVILQKSISKTANHSSKPPFFIPRYSKYFRRFAVAAAKSFSKKSSPVLASY
jgi:hypothetical protein